MADASETAYEVPRVPASAGALLFDARRRLLILKPSYKRGWTIPGGQLEEDGETPWQACRRETREECGIEIAGGRLVCVDFRPPKPPGRPGGLRFLFDCGQLSAEQLSGISLQAGRSWSVASSSSIRPLTCCAGRCGAGCSPRSARTAACTSRTDGRWTRCGRVDIA